METYLDNAATTRVSPEVADTMREIMLNAYGNPSSLHKKGMEAEKILLQTRMLLAGHLGVADKEILFTSGGTEANNLAIGGVLKSRKRRGRHLVVSAFEHPSVAACASHYGELGWEVDTVPVDASGFVDLEKLKALIRPDTVLVAVMQVNNELGTIQPIEEIGALVKGCGSQIHFHVDGVQGYGKVPINLRKAKVDSYSLSAHKIHGPKGIGALYLSSKAAIVPMLWGGSQQKGLRSGTENVPGAAGLFAAARQAAAGMQEAGRHMAGLKQHLYEGIRDALDGVHLNGSLEHAVPNILNLRFDNVRGEVLLHALESAGIYVSTGAACASNKSSLSATLKAIGLADAEVDSAIRFSFSRYTTQEEVDHCLAELAAVVPKLRRFTRK